ncbi:MAG: hypothetical protein ABH814_00860, partial [bacterium]
MSRIRNYLLLLKVFPKQLFFYARHPHFLNRKQRVAAGLGGFLLLVLAGSTGATLWGGRGDFASADFRVDDGFSQEV